MVSKAIIPDNSPSHITFLISPTTLTVEDAFAFFCRGSVLALAVNRSEKRKVKTGLACISTPLGDPGNYNFPKEPVAHYPSNRERLPERVPHPMGLPGKADGHQ